MLLISREGSAQLFPGLLIDLFPDTDYRVQLVSEEAERAAADKWDLSPDAILGTYAVTAIDGTDIRRYTSQPPRPPVVLWPLSSTGSWDDILADHPEFCDWGERGWRRPDVTSGVSSVELVSAPRADELGYTAAGATAVGSYLPTGADWTFRPRNNTRPNPIELFDLATLVAK